MQKRDAEMTKNTIDAEQILLYEGYENIICLKNYSYDDALVGVSEDGRAVYDYEKMVKWLMKTQDFSETDAIEWIDYNTIRALPYMGEKAPIIMYPLLIKEQFDLYETAMDNYDELADFSLEDLE